MSRENQPHLHTHCVIINTVKSDPDGQFRALERIGLGYWSGALDALYHAALATGLQREAGVRIERAARPESHWRIAGMDPAVEKRWSRRLAPSEQFRNPAGVSRGLLIQRKRQNRGVLDRPGLSWHFSRWFEEASMHVDVAHCLASVTGHQPVPVAPARIASACKRAIDYLARERSGMFPSDVCKAVAHALSGLAGPETVMQESARLLGDRRVVVPGRPLPAEYAAEGRLYAPRVGARDRDAVTVRAGILAARIHHQIAPGTVAREIRSLAAAGIPVSREAERQVEAALRTPGGLAMVDAPPCTERSIAFGLLVDSYRAQGYRVFVVGEVFEQAAIAAADCNGEATTLTWLLRAARRFPGTVDQKTLLAVNVTGEFGVPRLTQLMELADKAGAALLFTGSSNDPSAIPGGFGAGDLRRAMNRAGGSIIAIGRVPETAATGHGEQDDTVSAKFAELLQRGVVDRRDSPDDAISRLADDWTDYLHRYPDRNALVLASGQRAARRLTQQLRIALLGPDQSGPAYRIGVTDGFGHRCRTTSIDLTVGDRLRIGARCRAHGLVRGDTVRVQAVIPMAGSNLLRRATSHPGTGLLITGQDQRGRTLRFQPEDVCDWRSRVCLYLDYAVAARAEDWRPADRVFLLVDHKWDPDKLARLLVAHQDRLRLYAHSGAADRLLDRAASAEQMASEPDHVASLPELGGLLSGPALLALMSRELQQRSIAVKKGWNSAVAAHDQRIQQIEKRAFATGVWSDIAQDPAYQRFDRMRQTRARRLSQGQAGRSFGI